MMKFDIPAPINKFDVSGEVEKTINSTIEVLKLVYSTYGEVGVKVFKEELEIRLDTVNKFLDGIE